MVPPIWLLLLACEFAVRAACHEAPRACSLLQAGPLARHELPEKHAARETPSTYGVQRNLTKTHDPLSPPLTETDPFTPPYTDESRKYCDLLCLSWVIAGAAAAGAMSMWKSTLLVDNDEMLDSEMGKRNPLFDNARLMAICAVLVYHRAEGAMMEDPIAYGYSERIACILNVPVFAFISGLFSQEPLTIRRLQGLVTHIVVPFLIFQLPPVLLGMLGATTSDTWYLLALVIWRLLAAACSYVRPAVAVGSMLVLSCCSEYMTHQLRFETAPFNIAFTRTFKFLPYFALGYACPQNLITKVQKAGIHIKLAAVGCAGGLLWMSAAHSLDFINVLQTDFFDMDAAYLPLHYEVAFLQILARVVKNMAIILPVLCCVIPAGENTLTWVGQYTLYPYLLHRPMFVVSSVIMHYIGLASPISRALKVGLNIGYSMPVAVVLASWPIRAIFHWVVEPRWLDAWIAWIDNMHNFK